jgi:tRNA threonylcarbamoyladenosine biosynthesis protein TsaB
LDVGTRQSELLPEVVRFFLGSMGYSPGDISLMAVTTGPGYYTGIRVGLAYSTALAYSLGVKIVPAPTLAAMAHGVLETLEASGAPTPVAPLIPAGRGSIYAAVYSGPSCSAKAILEPSHIGVQDFINFLDSMNCAAPLIVGNDISSVAERLAGCRAVSPIRGMGEAMVKISRFTEPVDPAAVLATYLRSPC